jgi:hypothetical protein
MNRTSKRRAWTTAHVRELKFLARKKTPAKKIAKTLKRSEGATRQKAFIIGLSLWPAPGSADTELGVLMEPEVSHGKAEVYTRVQA